MNLLSKPIGVNRLALQTIALTIAGFDPSGGAGATADLQVMGAHGFAGVTALTALTVQSTKGVRRVQAVEAGFLRETLRCLGEDSPPAGVKIGMLATAENAGVVAEWLRRSGRARERVVLDPVIRSSSGAELLEAEGVRRLVRELLPVVGWVTPNIAELGALLGEPEPEREAIAGLARRLQGLGTSPPCQNQAEWGTQGGGGLNVVVTGGHLERPDDFLLTADGTETWFPGKRVEARGIHGSHGTGCVFSSALLCRLLLGDEPAAAATAAKAWVVRRLEGGV
ncbi:MAG TPA: hydroxymethylpyrimidine/phosphomethylpyrimidine kinase [Acidobacteriaceae bacterium]|jgi:hydroxymethylpyrimidine/phosphomethylpyrimidine kinase|nr:hydroxymethylpyrimidine/phosphomethylpyrimidine kinase [Acidobacteriaceae bacterium]